MANQERLQRIIDKLVKDSNLLAALESAEKGSIEINFSGASETVIVKVVVQ